jgi:hypothetical protein
MEWPLEEYFPKKQGKKQMKRCMTLLSIAFLIFPVFAEDIVYTVKKRTRPTFNQVFYQNYLNPGDRIKPAFINQIFIEDKIHIGYYIDSQTIGEVEAEALRIEGSDSFPQKILFDKNVAADYVADWIPTYYIESLEKESPDSIPIHEPHIEEASMNVFNDRWKNHFSPTTLWFNDLVIILSSSLIYSANSVFYITQLKDFRNDLYKANTIVDLAPTNNTRISDSRLEQFSDGDICTLYIHYRENRIRIYVDGEELYRWELMKVPDGFRKLFSKFPKTGSFPGGKDYKSYLAPDIFEPWPVLTLTEIKSIISQPVFRTTSNLRLRSLPGTNGKILATIPAGETVSLKETGEKETIDNITAPWVYVRTQDGKEGWCFSGYLQPVP